MSKCTYLECGYREVCDHDDFDCVLDRITHGQELKMIIRCKNCKYFMNIKGEDGHCRKLGQKTTRQWYCAEGKWRG